jgi:hypothetical protein
MTVFRTVVGFIAAWSVCSAAPLLGPGEAFDLNPIYALLKATGIGENTYGFLMASDGLAVASTLFMSRTEVIKPILLMSGAIWFYLGGCLVWGAWSMGLFSGGGVYSVIMGFAAWLTAARVLPQHNPIEAPTWK